MPRRPKGEKYAPPEIPTLLRDAQPTWREIEGERDASKRRERKRAQNIATDALVTMYRNIGDVVTLLDIFDPRIRIFCEDLKAHNGGRVPRPKGGRPPNENKRLRIAASVREAIEAGGKRRGSVDAALEKAADRFHVSYDTVRDIYYDRDPEWRRIVGVELARRKFEEG
jgi:hypothetical protein